MNNYKKKILIDLDGVLNTYNGNYEPDKIPEIKIGAKEFIEGLSKNFDLYLFTTRNSDLSKKWLRENELNSYFKDVTNIKIPAYLYIDDRCICFNGDFGKLLSEINNFEAYWK
ncbi:hypothetical protein IKQ26_08475 [bacterium]|nr:hypothetical protein [bacterium]